MGFPGGASGKELPVNADSVVKNLPVNAGDSAESAESESIPGSGRSPEGGQGNPLQYSSLENPIDRGVWQATVHSITNSWTQLK